MGYVDHPPLAPLLLTVIQFFFGSSIYVLRVVPALAAAIAVFYTGIAVKEIGGGKYAQLIAACSYAASPITMAFGGFYSMNALEPLFAVLLILTAIRIIKSGNTKLWLSAGIIMGLGVMNKHTFGVYIAAFVISIIAAGKWKLVFNKWFFAGAAISVIIFIPNIVWQVLNDFPSLEFYRNISVDKNVYTPPLKFILGQAVSMSPSTVPVWLAGFIFLLFSKRTKEFRFLAFLFGSLFLFMMLSGTSRSDRLAFAYPAAFAGGGLFFESLFAKYKIKIVKHAFVVFIFIGLALAFPIMIPYFSYETSMAYTNYLGFNTEIERGKKPPIAQLLADRIGWEEKVKMVINAYNSLSKEDKKHVIIAGSNYGQAGAIELYGKDFNLPPVACGHNNYYLWSKDRVDGNILLQLEQEDELTGLQRVFDKVEIYPAVFRHNFVSPHENNLVVFICRGPKIPPIKMLEGGKNYY
jgi:hypothetical protein